MIKKFIALMFLSPLAYAHAPTAVTLFDGDTNYVQIAAPQNLTQNYRTVMPLSPGTTSQVLAVSSVQGNVLNMGFTTGIAGSVNWGGIGGTLSNQSDLQAQFVSIGTSTAALKTQINSVSVATGTIQTQVAGIALATGTLQGQLNGLATTYLTLSSATATYLQPNAAAAIYLPTATAASTYLTLSSATATYAVKSNLAGTSTTGLLSSTDWNTFNNKGGGSGASSLAVTAGTAGGFATVASSPTAVLNFNSSHFLVSATGGATAFMSLNPSSATEQGNAFNGAGQLVQLNGSTQVPAVSGALLTNLTAANISAGSLGAGVIASSIAAAAVYPNAVASNAYPNITGIGAQGQVLNMNTHQINGVVSPTASTDAATKGYVDIATAAVAGGGILNQATLQAGSTAYPQFLNVGSSATVLGGGGLTVISTVTAGSINLTGVGNASLIGPDGNVYQISGTSVTTCVAGQFAQYSSSWSFICVPAPVSGGTPGGNPFDVNFTSANGTQFAGSDSFMTNGSTTTLGSVGTETRINITGITLSGVPFNMSGSSLTLGNQATFAPSIAPIDVSGTTSGMGMVIGDSNSATAFIGMSANPGTGALFRAAFGYGNGNAIMQCGVGRNCEFDAGSNTFGGNPVMYLTQTGQLGIGTTSAINAKLQVSSGTVLVDGTAATIQINNATGTAAFSANNTGNVIASSVTLSGFSQLAPRTAAQINALTPAASGQMYNCSNCTTAPVCISTGTAIGSWSVITSKTVACN